MASRESKDAKAHREFAQALQSTLLSADEQRTLLSYEFNQQALTVAQQIERYSLLLRRKDLAQADKFLEAVRETGIDLNGKLTLLNLYNLVEAADKYYTSIIRITTPDGRTATKSGDTFTYG